MQGSLVLPVNNLLDRLQPWLMNRQQGQPLTSHTHHYNSAMHDVRHTGCPGHVQLCAPHTATSL